MTITGDMLALEADEEFSCSTELQDYVVLKR